MTIKRIIALLLMLCLMLSAANAEWFDDDDDSFAIPMPEMYFEPIPWELDASPNEPIASCYLPDNAGYHDDSLDISVETYLRDTYDNNGKARTNRVWIVRVAIKDVSQLRTAMANPSRPTAKNEMLVQRMAQRVKAVLAINGDYFAYRSEGVIWRNGVQIRRDNPSPKHDVLYIDYYGDFHIVEGDHAKNFKGFDGEILHAFSFGPGLVVDGERISEERIKSSTQNVGKENLTQRIAFCQTGPLQYMIVATEGPEQVGSVGMTIREMADFCIELGAIQAYNLDGGSSTNIVLNNEKINAPTGKKRELSDCIWFATLVPNN